MRLGDYQTFVKKDSTTFKVYDMFNRVTSLPDGKTYSITERHRHRYEVNPAYIPLLSEKGLIISAHSFDNNESLLVECIELDDHPFFVATQAHPEFTSRFGHPNPLFYGFLKAAAR
jgi:CTP synthase